MAIIENIIFEKELEKKVKTQVHEKMVVPSNSDKDSQKPNIKTGERDPFTMPGKPSRLDLRRNIFSAPQGSPGPRGPNNLLILSEPIVDREARKSWPSYNLNNAYIQWLWIYWCELITETDLCQSHLDSRNGNRPFRPGLVPLKRTNDVENLIHLQ